MPESPASNADNPAHFALLRLLERHPEYSQRQLAAELNVSLGKTHYLMRALLEKGWVKANNFRRSDNKWAYTYLLTPIGVRAKLRLTRRFLELREHEYEHLRHEITRLRTELDQNHLEE